LRQGYPALLRGFLVAAASVVALAVLMSLSEIYTLDFHLSLAAALKRSGTTLLVALTVAILEEIFFRGMIFKGLIEDTRPATAFAVANLFYAAVHFVKPAKQFPFGGLDPLAGVRYVVRALEPLLDPAILPGLCGLFVIGLVLSYAFMRTGSLYLSIGLHAGWVFGIKGSHVYGDFSRRELGWLFGSAEPEIVSGVVTWLVIMSVGLAVHVMTRKRN
jgi:membrane protease YdiL (CAAX protease family)